MQARILCGTLLLLTACGTLTHAPHSPPVQPADGAARLQLLDRVQTGGLDPIMPAEASHAAALPRAAWDDYRHGTGRIENGTLKIHLRAQEVEWLPWGEDGPQLRAYSFSADGGAPRVPAPMIRVPAGTPVEVTVTNGLDRTLVLRGLNDRAEPAQARSEGFPIPAHFLEESLRLEPGETKTRRFTPTREGSFLYYARTLPVYAPESSNPSFFHIPEEIFGGDGPDAPFIGPLIVDPAGTQPPANEQVMLLTRWADPLVDPASWDVVWKMMINGRSWPTTERLTYTVGDTVTWRVINASLWHHPMHLHGFYFRVDARGNQAQDTTYAPADRSLAVTELLGGTGATMRITWVPETPGNWLFHCHLVRHMMPVQRMGGEHHHHGHGGGMMDHARDGMAGMLMGISVQPRPGEAYTEGVVERRLHLFTGRKERVFGDDPAYGFVLQNGPGIPAADSVLVPGSPLILTRGQMTEIVVHNRIDFPFSVHWHGLELASRYDGVADWSGEPGHVVPAIAPGDSLAVRIAPPRAGTFIYHVHSEPGEELAQGMYGAFLVLEPGQTFDPERDHVFVLGTQGTDFKMQMAVVNGSLQPGPLELRAGETYRLRFIHISSDEIKRVRLMNGEEPERWQVVAKDGADLPTSRTQSAPATLTLGVGETYDILWTPEAKGDRMLEIRTNYYPTGGRSAETTNIPVRVR